MYIHGYEIIHLHQSFCINAKYVWEQNVILCLNLAFFQYVQKYFCDNIV